jgi:hypothetical protein
MRHHAVIERSLSFVFVEIENMFVGQVQAGILNDF